MDAAAVDPAIGDQDALNSLLGAATAPGFPLPGGSPVGTLPYIEANVAPVQFTPDGPVKDFVKGGGKYVVVAQHANLLITPEQIPGFPPLAGRVVLADRGDLVTLSDDDAERPLALGVVVAVNDPGDAAEPAPTK